MAKLMWIAGILLIAAGVALGIVLIVSASPPVGIDIQTAATLLVGGVLALGVGSVIEGQAASLALHPVRSLMPEPVIPAHIPEFDPRGAKPASAEPAVTTSVTAAAVIIEEEVSRPTRDTIQALEQARQKIEQAFEERREPPPPAIIAPVQDAVEEKVQESVAAVAEAVADDAPAAGDEPAVEEAAAEGEAMDDGQLYVVEERIIRRHPARILSDGTVEAETREGWMRFENLEHLDEYLDAMEPARS